MDDIRIILGHEKTDNERQRRTNATGYVPTPETSVKKPFNIVIIYVT